MAQKWAANPEAIKIQSEMDSFDMIQAEYQSNIRKRRNWWVRKKRINSNNISKDVSITILHKTLRSKSSFTDKRDENDDIGGFLS